MTDRIHEQLSALVDDELTGPEQTLLAVRIARDPDLHGRLLRYQLISDALRNQLPERVDPQFTLRVQAALGQEPPVGAVHRGAHRSALLRPVAGLAVAASVAVIAVLSLQSAREEEPALPAVATAPASTDYIRAGDQAPPAVSPGTEKNLDIYLVNHNEYAANRGMQGMLPYVRIVSHEMNSDSRK